MHLLVGERLKNTGNVASGIVVAELERETPTYALYRGKKVFGNFDFATKSVRETDEKEWLDVYLRVQKYSALDDSEYVEQRRALARTEARVILGQRQIPVWPEPLDLWNVPNHRDAFTNSAIDSQAEPIVVFARPQGERLPTWRNQLLAFSSLLGVLAELLEFLRLTHDEGLFVLAFDPEDVVIDQSGRVHYLGSDHALPAKSPLLGNATPAEAWNKLFPPNRFPIGYSAPECFDAEIRPDMRSDLYSWACVAFALLTASDPASICREQQRSWWSFQQEHADLLHQTLGRIPAEDLTEWAGHLGLHRSAVMLGWPFNFVHVIRLCLNPDRSRRPSSVAEWKQWFTTPPLPQVAHFEAIYTSPTAARLILDIPTSLPDLDLIIQRNLGSAPAWPGEGNRFYEGTPRRALEDFQVPLTTENVFYTAFLRRNSPDGVSYSNGVASELWNPTEEGLKRWAEIQADRPSPNDPPIRASMVLNALGSIEVAESLQASASPRVRRWGLNRLDQGLRNGTAKYSHAERILWRYVHDPLAEIRLPAAVILWSRCERQSVDLLVKIFLAVEEPPIDRVIDPMDLIERLVLPESFRQEAMQRLDRTWPARCPICQKSLRLAERADHLREEHQAMEFDGELQPLSEVRGELWRRVFEEEDQSAHQRLLDLYPLLPRGEKSPWAEYIRDLDRYLASNPEGVPRKTGTIPLALPYRAVDHYLNMLRNSAAFEPIATEFFHSQEERLRRVGRETLASLVMDRWKEGPKTAESLYREFERFDFGADSILEKISLCKQAILLGLPDSVANECMDRLEHDRLVPCDQCLVLIPYRELERHLRQSHHIFEFRARRGTYRKVKLAMLTAVTTPPRDQNAWESFVSLAEERYPQDADKFIVHWLITFLRSLNRAERMAGLPIVAEHLVRSGDCQAYLLQLLRPRKTRGDEQIAIRLALSGLEHRPESGTPEVLERLKPWLGRKDVPRKARLLTLAALLRPTHEDQPILRDLLRAYIAHAGKLSAIRRLQQLEARVGQRASIDAVIRQLDDEVRMTCPRCGVQLPKRDMVRHLWDRHQLVLDGQRVRDPWKAIDDWIIDYRLEKDASVYRRCRETAQKADPKSGLEKLYRRMLRKGIQDRDVLEAYLRVAQQQSGSVCPRCFALMPSLEVAIPPPLIIQPTRLEGFGYRVTLEKSALGYHATATSPKQQTFHASELSTAWVWGIFGTVTVFLLASIAIGTLIWFSSDRTVALLVMACLMGVTLIFAGVAASILPPSFGTKQRLVRAAWNLLVPELGEAELHERDFSFLAGLARGTVQLGGAFPNSNVLEPCQDLAFLRAGRRADALNALAALIHLEAASARNRGDDGAAIVIHYAEQAIQGELPLPLLDLICAYEFESLVTPRHLGAKRRIQILMAESAFRAGWSAEDWLDLRKMFPRLQKSLALDEGWRWQQLYHLWRETRQQPNSFPVSAFIKAHEHPGGERRFQAAPDFLFNYGLPWCYAGSEGVWIQDECIASYSPTMDLRVEDSYKKQGFDVLVGSRRIPLDPSLPAPKVVDLRRVFDAYFTDFLPRVRGNKETSDPPYQFRIQHACAECGQLVLPYPGQLAKETSKGSNAPS